jgi:hypothetical protein
MTVATWILAIATVALAAEGGTAVWKYIHVRPGRTRRELAAMREEIALLRLAAWMDVATAGQGTRRDIDERIRALLMSDGWRPDVQAAEQAGYFDLSRIQDGIPGVTDQ